MLIAKLSIDGRGRIQIPSTFVRANDWTADGMVLLKNHTNSRKVTLEYVPYEPPHTPIQEEVEAEVERKRVEEVRAKVGLY